MSNLPQSIIDAIDGYGRSRSEAAWHFVDNSGETRAALEAAIAEDTLRQVHAELLCAASQPDVLGYLHERMREIRGPNPKPVEPDEFPNDGKPHSYGYGKVEVAGRSFDYSWVCRNWHTMPPHKAPSRGPVFECLAHNLPFRQDWASGFSESLDESVACMRDMIERIAADGTEGRAADGRGG